MFPILIPCVLFQDNTNGSSFGKTVDIQQ